MAIEGAALTEHNTEGSRPTTMGDIADETSEVPPIGTHPARDSQKNVRRGESNGSATAGGIIAIVALVFALAPLIASVGLGSGLGFGAVVLILLAVPMGICAIVFGFIGLSRADRMRSPGLVIAMAIVGVLGGFVAAVASLVWLFSPGGAVF